MIWSMARPFGESSLIMAGFIQKPKRHEKTEALFILRETIFVFMIQKEELLAILGFKGI